MKTAHFITVLITSFATGCANQPQQSNDAKYREQNARVPAMTWQLENYSNSYQDWIYCTSIPRSNEHARKQNNCN